MYYRFRRTWAKDYTCIVEAENLEEAKRKAKIEEDCEWIEDDENYCPMYVCSEIVLEDGMSIDDVDSDYIERCDWKGVEDDSFFCDYK